MQNKVEILLIDDRWENLLGLEAILTDPDWSLVKARSGQAALSYLTLGDPALILIRTQLAGMNGFETAEKIKQNENTKDIPILFLTSDQQSAPEIQRCYQIGGADCLSEPYDARILKSKVSVFVDLAKKTLKRERQIREGEDLIRLNKKHSDFLAQASLLLGKSLNYEDILPELSQLAVTSEVADWFAVLKLDQNDALKPLFIQSSSPLHSERMKEALNQYLPHIKLDVTLFPDISDHFLKTLARDENDLEFFRSFGFSSGICAPLSSRGKTRGLLVLFNAESKRKYSTIDLLMAQDLARRMMMAFDNAKFFRQAQTAIKVRDDFLSVASHELKTPLTPLKLQVQMLMRALRNGNLSDYKEEKLEKILRSSERQLDRLSLLIDGLLDIAKINQGKFSLNLAHFDLVQMVQELLERVKSQSAYAKHEIFTQFPDTLLVYWDRLRMEQAILNLINNSIKFGRDRPIHLSAVVEQEQVVIRLKDEGIGIAKEDQTRIFERFERAVSSNHFSGLGLGLYIVNQALEAHHGKISLESELGKGSTFTLSLPIRATESPLRRKRHPLKISEVSS